MGIDGPGVCPGRRRLHSDDGRFDEFHTFLLTDWLHHTPKEVLAKNFNVPESTFAKVPTRELFIFPRDLPRALEEEKKEAYAGTGACHQKIRGVHAGDEQQ